MKKNEEGMVMIEAIYIVIIAIALIFFIFNVGAVYYNKIVISAIANETANSLATTYSVPGKDPFYMMVEEQDIITQNPYRYVTYGHDNFERALCSKGVWYSSYLVYEQEFNTSEVLDFSGISVECRDDFGIGKVVTVNIKRSYPAFVLYPMVFWEMDMGYELKASGKAVCYDIIHQMNGIALSHEIQNSISGQIPALDDIAGIINNLQDIWSLSRGK